jgi:hypothetical protein
MLYTKRIIHLFIFGKMVISNSNQYDNHDSEKVLVIVIVSEKLSGKMLVRIVIFNKSEIYFMILVRNHMCSKCMHIICYFYTYTHRFDICMSWIYEGMCLYWFLSGYLKIYFTVIPRKSVGDIKETLHRNAQNYGVFLFYQYTFFFFSSTHSSKQ